MRLIGFKTTIYQNHIIHGFKGDTGQVGGELYWTNT